MLGSFLELQKNPHPIKTEKKKKKKKNHQKTNKREEQQFAKERGSTIWKLHPVFLFFFGSIGSSSDPSVRN
jgi:hypothetical protein